MSFYKPDARNLSYTTMMVMKNPAIKKKMPAWLIHGIARLKKHTNRQAIHVEIKYATKTCQAWKV